MVQAESLDLVQFDLGVLGPARDISRDPPLGAG
jgi:hypothetical protein